MGPTLITPDWPAPARVRAAVTTRAGGVSPPPYDSLNLGDHVGDDPAAVARNRARLINELQLTMAPAWLRQVHATRVIDLDSDAAADQEADASFTTRPGQPCVVLSADCLPVLFCDDAGTVVAAAHAGWRGLLAGVLESTVAALPAAPSQLMAWFGPAIGPEAFEVGEEVRRAFVDADPDAMPAFRPGKVLGKWMADICQLARRRLQAVGVSRISGGYDCTYTDSTRFYSFRRDGRTGRIASLIWIQSG